MQISILHVDTDSYTVDRSLDYRYTATNATALGKLVLYKIQWVHVTGSLASVC